MAILPVHQMIQHPDILGNFRQGVAFGQQQQERQETRADQQQLRKLAAGIQQGDPAAYSQAAAIDPAAAGKQLMAGDAMARRAEGLIKMMEDADATNPQQAQALWQNYGVPFARQFSQGTEPTTDWAQAKPMLASLKARIAMAKAGDEVKGADVKVVGNALVDASGRVLYQGQPDSKYFQTDQGLVEVGPGGAREVRLDGQQGAAPQGMPQTAPATMDGPPQDPSPQAVQKLIQGLAGQYGGQVTSLQRTPERNARVGGVPNSQHIPGTAGDVVFRDPQAKAAYMQAARSAGLEVIDEGDHVHAELPPGARRGATAQAAPQGGRPLLPASSIYQREASERAQRADERASRAESRYDDANRRAEEQAALARRGNAPAGFRFRDDGALEPIPGGPKPAGTVATEGERKAATLMQRMEGSLRQLQQAVSEDEDASSPSVLAEFGRSLPFVGQAAANVLNSPERQRVEAAQLDILDAALTLGTGAAYTREQIEGYRRSFFPQIGDSEQTIADKEERLQNVLRAARTAAGRAAPQGQPQQPSGGRYQVGQVIEANGKRYRVTGGDPNDPDVEEVR